MATPQSVKFSVEMGAGCEEESWSPEVVALNGDGATVMRKLQNFDMSLPKRRIYVSLVETPSQAELSLYERSDSKVRVSRWKGKPAPDLRMSLDSAILENKGVHCVGEQTKAIVGKLAGLSSEPEVPSPASAAAAFGHSVKAHERDYIRATFYLLC